MKNEPAITIGSVTAAVAAGIALLVAFGVPITEDQQIAILSIVAAVAPIATAIITRRFVTPAAGIDSGNTHRADT